MLWFRGGIDPTTMSLDVGKLSWSPLDMGMGGDRNESPTNWLNIVLGGDDLYGVIWFLCLWYNIYIYYPKGICFEHHPLNFVPGRGDGTVPKAFYLIYMYQRWYTWISWEDGNKQLWQESGWFARQHLGAALVHAIRSEKCHTTWGPDYHEWSKPVVWSISIAHHHVWKLHPLQKKNGCINIFHVHETFSHLLIAA